MRRTEKLQQLLHGPEAFILPGAFDAMTARIVEETGFQAVYASGAGIANAQLGWADVGLTTLTEIAQVVSWMQEVTTIPIVVDADTGFGNAINMQRTVKVLEKAGASGLQIEDQVMPKKCGHFNNKDIISCDEMVGKIKAALDARVDDQLAIIARTDAIGVEGIEAAIERAHAYKEAGAHAIFIEAPTTIAELARIPREVPGIPHIINLVEGGKTPLVSRLQAQELGFQVVLCANTALRGAIYGANEALSRLYRDESHENVHEVICTWEQRQQLFKLHEIQEREKQYAELIKK